jgi:hypothetical protein
MKLTTSLLRINGGVFYAPGRGGKPSTTTTTTTTQERKKNLDQPIAAGAPNANWFWLFRLRERVAAPQL